MKKLFPLIMGLSVLLSSSSLVSAFVTISRKNNQSQVNSQPTNSVNLIHRNEAVTEIFDQPPYGGKNLVLTIRMEPDVGTYGYKLIEILNIVHPTVGVGKAFYQKFLGSETWFRKI